jgi:hypothetical protein
MMKRGFAIALLGTALGLGAHAPAGAAPLPVSGITAAQASDGLTRVGGSGRCFELPVVQNAIAFIELLRDEEFDRGCSRRFHGDDYTAHEYEAPRDLSTKDGAYAEPHPGERVKPRKY